MTGRDAGELEKELRALFQCPPALFAFLVADAGDGIWFRSLENPPADWLSPRLKRVLGFDDASSDTSPNWIRDRIVPDDIGQSLLGWNAKGGEPYDRVVRYLHRDGRTLWFRCRGQVIEGDAGKPTYLIGYHIDITPQMEAREALAACQKQSDLLTAEIEKLGGAIAHDLRAPLRAMTTFGGLLQTEQADALDPEGQKSLSFVLDGANRMQLLIADLLKLLRLPGRGDPLVQVDLNTVASDVVAEFAARFESAGGRIDIGELPVVQGRPAQLNLLLTCLVDNALKFAKGPPMVEIEGGQNQTFHTLGVKDRGIGFDEQQKDRIFELFQRLHTVSEYPGTGVGLAVCKKIAEVHNGSITASAREGGGAEFVVNFPRSNSA